MSYIVPAQLSGFESFQFSFGPAEHSVYYAGANADPPLLVMPEISGVSPGLLLFAQRLVDARFQVFIPLLFGVPGRRAPVRNAMKLCISHEFAYLRAGVSAPVTHWLRALAAHLCERTGASRIGAIGMCLTGAFAIPLVIDPWIVAAVAAQPAVPLSPLFAALGIRTRPEQMGRLNVSAADIAQARARLTSGDARLFALRCRADRICPVEKLDRFRHEFPQGLQIREYGDPNARNRLGERAHATFTKEYRLEPHADSNHYSRQAFADLVAFFDQNLRMPAR